MEELKLTPSELRELTKNSKLIGRGFFGSVFKYKDRLIKLDSVLYSLLNGSDASLADKVFSDHYRYSREDFADVSQIETLAGKQKDITLTKMPLGVVRVDSRVPGVIIPYHEGYQDLEKMSPTDYKKLLVILKKLLLAVQELADNEISHADLIHRSQESRQKMAYNVMYKDETPQIVDLEGQLITCGKHFKDAKEMYNELGRVVLSYFKANKLPIEVTGEDITDEAKARGLINELENRVRGK